MKAYPIKFEPILQEKIWGGDKLQSVYKKETYLDQVGESWEVSGVKGFVSRVSQGAYQGRSLNALLKEYGPDLVGTANYERFGNEFPLLIKFLDAKENLSVQVHPDDAMAQDLHQSKGKTEMWYIMDHEPEAEVVLGMKAHDKEVLRSVTAKNIDATFDKRKVSKGDIYFIPAGQVHAIGAGVMVAEIQQTSDITYRVYDWDRVDQDGNKRDLHIDASVAATKLLPSIVHGSADLPKNKSINKVDCSYFTTNVLEVAGAYKSDYTDLDSFVILICVSGNACIATAGGTENIAMGQTVLLPASTQKMSIIAQQAKFLEVYIKPVAALNIAA